MTHYFNIDARGEMTIPIHVDILTQHGMVFVTAINFEYFITKIDSHPDKLIHMDNTVKIFVKNNEGNILFNDIVFISSLKEYLKTIKITFEIDHFKNTFSLSFVELKVSDITINHLIRHAFRFIDYLTRNEEKLLMMNKRNGCNI